MHGALAEMTGTYRTYMDPVSTPPISKLKNLIKLKLSLLNPIPGFVGTRRNDGGIPGPNGGQK